MSGEETCDTGEMGAMEELMKLRKKIDELDMELLNLLNRRMELAREVGQVKAAHHLCLFDPRREEAICDRLSRANPGPLYNDSLRAIYMEIFSASRRLQPLNNEECGMSEEATMDAE